MLPLNVACNNQKLTAPASGNDCAPAAEWADLRVEPGQTYVVTRAFHLTQCPAINVHLECRGEDFAEVMRRLAAVDYVFVTVVDHTHNALLELRDVSRLLRSFEGRRRVRIQRPMEGGGLTIFDGSIAACRTFLLLEHGQAP